MPADNLTIHCCTASFCSERDGEQEENREEERGSGCKSSSWLDRWYNVKKERGRESYEFKN